MENALYVGGFEMEQKTAMKISMVSIVGNILLSLFKALAGIVANSGAMISDAIHSASDVFSTIVVIIGIRLSGKESDKEHPYGHERMECVAAILLATILAATGLFIGWSAVEKITVQDDSALAVPGILALVAAVVSIAVKEAMFWYTRAGAKKIDSGCMAPPFRCIVVDWRTCWYCRSQNGLSDFGCNCEPCYLYFYRKSGN